MRSSDRLGGPPSRRDPTRLHSAGTGLQGRGFGIADGRLSSGVGGGGERGALRRTPARGSTPAGIALAREIQQSFLPTDFDPLGAAGPELYARQPAREVSGDLYDFFPLPDGRLAFFLGDVSGKGMPAALFMIAVRTLIRHLAPSASGPAELLSRLNAALCADNPTNLYVTLGMAFTIRPTAAWCWRWAAIRRRCCDAPTAESRRWRLNRA